ncbi:hypothetical protein J4E85_005423 [Alternaria conjuncta]|uniref:uncharacterized protein n=1 Tax=Alternaria conjuncta TaxID=181017 RepID=UPI00221E7639|nr:uncharacterized protein J4E85_005423 [Alternaria conjuncta]KAI4928802.1 hypothetical protein J4E85_005423 [Alternaria conjuncta]
MDTLLESPVLTITAYKSEVESLGGQDSPELLDITWVKENKTFDRTYMELYGKCQNTEDYKWGFSLLQLIISMVLLLAWTVGIYIMWIYTHFTIASNNGHFEEVSGEYRAVLKLAAAMRIELDIEDTDLSVLREKQLKERVDKEIQGGTVFHAYPDSTLKTHSIREGLKTWFKKDKWWFLAMLVDLSLSYFTALWLDLLWAL